MNRNLNNTIYKGKHQHKACKGLGWKKTFCMTGLLLVGVCTFAGCGKTLPAADSTSNVSKASQEELPSYSKDVFAMDTYMTLTAYGDQAEEAVEAAILEIDRIEQMVSTGIETSEVAVINEKGEGTISEDTAHLLERSKEIYESTQGIFDITIYPIMEAWGFTTQKYRVPSDSELEELRGLMGSEYITMNEEENQVILEKKGMKIDLGGIAKGYTSSRVMEIFREYGIEHSVISLGGNVHLLGDKPDGSLWRIAIEDPEDTSNYIGILQTKDQAVITSGGYERFFEEDGKKYHHIIDPATGYPSDSGLSSVTIVSEDGTLADGLSTSLFIMGEDNATEYWRAHAEEFDIILVRDDGSILVSEGIGDTFASEKGFSVITKD